MAGMREVGEEVVRSYEERQQSLKGLRATTSKLLQGYRQAQQTLREELSEAKEAWQKTAATLQKKRHQERSK